MSNSRLFRFFSSPTNLHFGITKSSGFLPSLPIISSSHPVLDNILDELPVVQRDGSPGLLGKGQLGEVIERELPNLTNLLNTQEEQNHLAGLFRDYSFLASAYLLEPTYLSFIEKGQCFPARPRLPSKLAEPLRLLAQKLGYPVPFLNYAYGYALNNWKVEEEKGDSFSFQRVQTIRRLHGGRDEENFILNSVKINQLSPQLLASQEKILESAFNSSRENLNSGLSEHYEVLNEIYSLLSNLWTDCKPEKYSQIRIFTLGQINNQKVFPNGVVYGNRLSPYYFRGKSSTQDSILASAEALFNLTYRSRFLNSSLNDIANYRPDEHQRYIEYLRTTALDVNLRQYISFSSTSSFLLLKNLNKMKEIRSLHWAYSSKYLGSSLTWFPTQIVGTLKTLKEVTKNIEKENLNSEQQQELSEIKEDVEYSLRQFNRI